MEGQIMATGSVPQGLYVRGELRGGKVKPGREKGDGTRYADRYELAIGVGDDVYRVEYSDEDTARAAVAEANDGPAEVGTVLTLPVGARAGARGGAEAFVFWYGRGERSAEDALSW